MSLPGLLVVNASESWGGNELWAVRTASGMAERGHPVRFIWSHEAIGERVRAAGLDQRRLMLRSDADLPAILSLCGEMRAVNARAALLTRWREYFLGGLAARLAGRPRVVLRLGLRMTPREDFKRKLIFRLADRIIVNAAEIRETLMTRPWIDGDRIHVVVNGLDLDRWRPRWEPPMQELGARFRREHGIDPAAPLLLSIGNLTGQKDQQNLITAFSFLHERLPASRLFIVGEGMLRPALEEQIQALGLGESVRLVGFVSEPSAALAAADLFVLSSANEGMSRALVEAAATGLPIVSTDVSGARHCVEDGLTGRVVPFRNPEALAEAMESVLTAPEADRLRMGSSARELAEERFDEHRMLDETQQVLFG